MYVAHLLLLAAACLCVCSSEAEAQRRARGRGSAFGAPEFGPRFGYDFKFDEWILGAQLRIPGPMTELLLSYDSYYVRGVNPWQLNADLVLRPGRSGALYFGTGVGFFHQVTTDVAPNLVVGLHPQRRRRSRLAPYAEGRWTFLDNAAPFRFVFGLNLALGR